MTNEDLIFLERRLSEAPDGISDDALSERYAINKVLHRMMPEPKCVQEPNYCRDLSAAVELVERLLPHDHRQHWNVGKWASCYRAFIKPDFWGEAATPALALCIALVRSLQKSK